MARMIDADTLIAQIWSEHKKTEESYDLCVDELKEVFCGIVTLIDAQPTAYDPDKVVKQLEELKSLVPENRILEKPKELGMFIAYRKAIQIVKGGGVDA